MPCSKVSINTNYKCDKAACICIPTGGKPCICICENENGDIVRCDDCKCYSDTCQCKCDYSKCTCIVTKGASCVCVCRDERGNFKSCECCCIESDIAKFCCEKKMSVKSCDCCVKKQENESCGGNCKCDGIKNDRVARRDGKITKNYKCNRAGCVCVETTNEKPCVCICENKNAEIVRCDDCKCYSDTCQCKCDDSKCTCIVTRGASCVCVCRDEMGNFKTCECCFIKSDNAKSCCEKKLSVKSCECCIKKQENESCGGNCKCDGIKNDRLAHRDGKITKNYKCDKAACICIPTGGKPCICICENENGEIVRCDNCKCYSDTCQCKCDDSKCTCIVTKGASCVCVCRDERGNFKTCECCCIESDKTQSCCEKKLSVKSFECCSNNLEKKKHGASCRCDGKRNIQVERHHLETSMNNKCNNCDNCECSDAISCCKDKYLARTCNSYEKLEKKSCGGSCRCTQNSACRVPEKNTRSCQCYEKNNREKCFSDRFSKTSTRPCACSVQLQQQDNCCDIHVNKCISCTCNKAVYVPPKGKCNCN